MKKQEGVPMNMNIGRLPHGPRNLISDVPGVRVGHCTVDAGDCHTGVTVVLPPGDTMPDGRRPGRYS